MKLFLTAAVSLILIGIWGVQRLNAFALRCELELQLEHSRELIVLREERDNLRRKHRVIAEHTGRETDEMINKPRQGALSTKADTERQDLSTLASGSYLGSSAWKNRGRADPASAVETMLWAGAGGDLETLQNVLELDDVTRHAAEALLERFPEMAKKFAGAEHFVATFTSSEIPLGEVRLDVQSFGPELANAYLMVRIDDESRTATTPEHAKSASESPPPSLPGDPSVKLHVLGLRRQADGWRITVPPKAITRIADRIAGPATP